MKWILIFPICCSFLHVVTAIFNKLMAEELPDISIGSWKENDFHGEWHTNSSPPLGKSPYSDSIFVPTNVRGVSLVCNATYPIEWKFHREHWGGRTRFQFALQTTRISDGLDAQSFSSELSILGFDSSVSGNYTCQKVGVSEVSSSLYIFWEGTSPPYLTLARSYRKPVQVPFQTSSKSFMLPCTVAVPTVVPKLYKTVIDKEVELPQNRSVAYDPRIGFILTSLKTPFGRYTCQVGEAEEDEGDGDVLIFDVIDADDGPRPEFNETIKHGAFYHMNSSSKAITCCSAGSKAPRLKLVECSHPTICALAKHTLHMMETSRIKNGNCATANMHALNAGIFRCVGGGIDVVREYFYPIPDQNLLNFRPTKKPKGRGSDNNSSSSATTPSSAPVPSPPEPYYSWNEARHDKMMLVTKLTRPVYVGQEKRFYCKVSHFYYSQGIVWGIKYNDEDKLEFVGGDPHKPPMIFGRGGGAFLRNRHFEIMFQRNMASIDLTIAANMDYISCYAPIWNSTEWGKKTLVLEPKTPKQPTVVGGPSIQVAWYLNDTHKNLECVFDGDPSPTVVWKRGNMSTALHTSTSNGTSKMLFPLVGLEAQNEYQCIISNVAGNVTRRFKVTVLHSSSSAMSAALILSLLGFTGVTIALGLVFRYLRSQKSVISHLTSLAFKDVTGEGDPPPTPGNRASVPTENGGAMLPPHITISSHHHESPSPTSTSSLPEKDISNHDHEEEGTLGKKGITSPHNNSSYGFSYQTYSSSPEELSPSAPGVGHRERDPFEGFSKLQ